MAYNSSALCFGPDDVNHVVSADCRLPLGTCTGYGSALEASFLSFGLQLEKARIP